MTWDSIFQYHDQQPIAHIKSRRAIGYIRHRCFKCRKLNYNIIPRKKNVCLFGEIDE